MSVEENIKKSKQNYVSKMDSITILANPGTRDRWKAAAEKSGLDRCGIASKDG